MVYCQKFIKRIFVKSALSTPMLVFTTATYNETPFQSVMEDILGDTNMLTSRVDPTAPFVFAVSSKMSSSPTQLCLFRNYNYSCGGKSDTFVVDPKDARKELGLKSELDDDIVSMFPDFLNGNNYSHSSKCSNHDTLGLYADFLQSREKCCVISTSRHLGSFRVFQRAALRATTAAPTIFKPVLMGGELYCDGGIVSSNPAAIAIHEARCIFPNIPIEMIVSCGTGRFIEEKNPSKIGWDGIICQIIDSATDGEQTHNILEDVLGQGKNAQSGQLSMTGTRYYRFNPVIGSPESFPLDGTDPDKIEELRKLTIKYMQEKEQKQKLHEISEILKGI